MLTVYKASAGSGKTYTLALRYISILLGIKITRTDGSVRYVLNSDRYAPGGHRRPNRHRGILAITFTNKATAEMKQRIILRLHDLSRSAGCCDQEPPYATELSELFACSRGELADAASLALKELLCDYSQFNISTIDSFFQSVLRTFAREVNHQGDYAVELNDADAVGAGIGMMLDEINYGGHPRARQMKRWIDNLMVRRVSEGARFNVFDADSAMRADLRKFVGNMCGEPFRRRSAEMEAYLKTDAIRRLGLAVADIVDRNFETEKRALAGALSEAMMAEGVAFDQMKNNFGTIVAKFSAGDELTAADAGYSAGAGFTKWLLWDGDTELKPLFTVTKLPKEGRNPIYPSVGFVRAGQRFAAGVRELYVKRKLLLALLTACYNLEFLGFVSDFIDIYRRDNNLILLSDTNELLRRIIREEELPFIYERMGMNLTNLLIDEFQDTSRMQWENLRPLVANSLAENHDNLIIGDVKQAIYRFRNSDSSMLAHDVENVDFPRNHVTQGNNPAENTNYRSAHALVRFNNTLFSYLSELLSVPGYEGVCQALPGLTEGKAGYVRLDFFPESDDDENSPALDALAADILRQHRSGYSWRDIAVLVRARGTGVAIVNYLMARYPEIPLISDEALLLERSAAVQLILSMLRIVDEAYAFTAVPEAAADEKNFADSREVNMTVSRFNFYLGDGFAPVEALNKAIADNPEAAAKIHLDVADVLRQRPANPVALVETIVASKLGEDLRRDEYVFIAAFQDVVDSFFSLHDGGIREFLAWWEEHRDKLALASPPDIDAVTVMTIHKSKGLEWPCVHIPDCAWAMSRNDPEIWYDVRKLVSEYVPEAAGLVPPMLLMKSSADFGLPESPLAAQYAVDMAEQTADALNMTYVAFTRASNELIVSCRASVDSKGNMSFKGVGRNIADAFARAEECCGDDSADGKLTVPLSLAAPEPPAQGDGSPAPLLRFWLGSPTVKVVREEAEAAEGTMPCGAYSVVFREDTRELTTVEDVFSEARIDIGGEVGADSDDSGNHEKYSDPVIRAAAERGTNIHNVLAMMRRFSDMSKAISYVGNVARIPAEGRREISEILTAAFRSGGPRVAAWFSDDVSVLPEREIYDPATGEIHRPDRVVLYPDGNIDLIDYKFTTGPRPSHKKQIARYSGLLASVFPDAAIRGFIWYPERMEIVEVRNIGPHTVVS